MKKLTILVDMDDTMEDLLPAWVAELNRMSSASVSPEEITDWDIGLFFPCLSKQQLFSPLLKNEFWDTVLPKNGAQEYVRRLMDDGHEVYIVTASHYKTVCPKIERVLLRFFPYIRWEQIIIASNKDMVSGDVLIDDAPHNHSAWRGLSILMDSPHNRGSAAESCVRAADWKEVYEIICKYIKSTDYGE